MKFLIGGKFPIKSFRGKNRCKMSIAKEEIFELCNAKKVIYSKIFEKAYNHVFTFKDDSSQIITFSLILHERVKEVETKTNNRLTGGMYHLIWIEHFLNHLYKKQNFSDLQKICIFYKSMGQQNLDQLLLFIIETYLYISSSRFLSTESLFKVIKLFDQPKESQYNQLCLTWKTLEVVHCFVKERIETFKKNEIIRQYLQESINIIELGQKWDPILQKTKFIKLDTETYSFLKRTKETLAKISGDSKVEQCSVEGVKLFNASVGLFNEKKYNESILKLKEAISIFEQSNDKAKLERVLALMGKVYYAQNIYEDSMNFFEKAIHSSDLSQETFKFYIEQFEKCKYKLKYFKRTLYSEKLKREENILILNEELKALKSTSCLYGDNTYKEQLVIVEKLLEYIYKEKCIERVMLILEKQKICCSIDYNLSTLTEAISNCQKCIEIVKDSSYDDLAICYAEMGIYQLHFDILSKKEKLNEWKKYKENDDTIQICNLILPMMKKGKELKYFKGAIKIWKALIEKSNVQNFKKYFKDLDKSFDHLESISNLIKYYGYHSLYIQSLEVLIMFNKLREEDDGIIKTKLAEIMIDLGNTSKAQQLLEEKVDNPYYDLIQVYYEMEKGNLSDINKILTDILSKCKGSLDYLSLCRYFIAQVYFYENDQSAIDSCLQGLSSSIKKFSNSQIIEKVQDKQMNDDQIENLNQTDFTSVCKSLLQLAKIYESRGFFKESTHTLLQGLFLSLSSSSDVFVLQYLYLLGELEKKRNRYSKSNLYLQVAESLWNYFDEIYKIDNRYQYLSHLLQLGDLYRLTGDFQQSQETFEKGFSFIEKIKDDIDQESYQFRSITCSFYLSYSDLQNEKGIDPKNSLMKVSNIKLLIPEEAKVNYYLGKYYLIQGDQKKAEEYFTKVYDLTSLLIPSLSRGSLSSLALLSKEDHYISSFFSNISMNLGLRLKKLGLSKSQSLSDSFSSLNMNNNIFNPDTADFLKEFQEILPEDMNVCTLSLSFDYSKLIISRITKDKDPIVIEIPLIKSKSEISNLIKINNISNLEENKLKKGKDGEQWRSEIKKSIKEDQESTLYNVLSEFEKILEESNESTKSQITDKKIWWKKRHELDNRMKNLTEYIEHILLSQWKGIISESILSTSDSSKLENLFCEKFKQCGYENKKELKSTVIKSRKKSTESVKKVHTILILDKLIQKLPWENLPILKDKSISRMPSLMFLYLHLLSCKTEIDLSKTFYVLNPSGDLINTQKTFEGYFKEKGWEGTNQITSNEYKNNLENYDLFVYMGHGGGEKYCKGSEIAKLRKCAVTLLMGCSSGVLYENGEYDPDGIVLNYILGKCPCVVANLWDVTDGDCDRFSMELLENCHSKIPLTESVIKSREKCKLKYLIGCAPVCYGLPIKIKI